MSKLSSLIQATLTGDVRAARQIATRYIHAGVKVSNSPSQPSLPIDTQVRLNVTLTQEVFLSDVAGTGKDRHKCAIKALKRAMLEEVFGEFRSIIIEARAAVYAQDLDRIERLLSKLEHQMFEEN